MSKTDPKGYYAILDLTSEANSMEIKIEFRRKAMELHPDRNKSANATSQFQLLNEAYGVLSDPASRAQYDTMSIDTSDHASAEAEGSPPDPIVCSCCGKVTAQPRYAIFFEVKSFIVMTKRSVIQGIFCSACAEKKALKASAISWVLGWWGIPWGFIYTIHAISNNLMGGKRPYEVNARLAAHQAWFFAAIGKINMARAVALDALDFAKKLKSDQAYAKIRKSLGYNVSDEGAELRFQIEKFLEAVSGSGSNAIRLKDSWALFRRPFYIQGLVGLTAIGTIWYAVQNDQSISSSSNPPPYIASPQSEYSPTPTYIRPLTAPNGEPWPLHADYVRGFPCIHTNGWSKVTVDNSQNDSDVFVKLVSVYGQNTFPVRAFFIPAHSSFTAKNLTAGSYDVRYRDLNSGHLSRSEQFTLEEIKTNDGIQFSDFTMTLFKVRNGNMHTYDLSETEF
jgi:hypothetical protein